MKRRGEHSPLTPPRAAQPTRRAYSGGGMAAAYIVPPPRRWASPSQKTKRRGLLPPVAALLPVTNPSFNGSTGEGQPPAVAGGRAEEKNANVHVCVFFRAGRRPAAPPPHRHSGAYSARPAFRLAITHSVIRPTADVSEVASPKFRSERFPRHNRPIS
jgi:hypothetical protein